MTATLEAYNTPKLTLPGDEALAIIERYRSTVDDHFTVEPLETEFPTLARHLGDHAVQLAHGEDNKAGAFKWRGAFVGAEALAQEGHNTLIVPSAGNHARGAILAAKALELGIHVVIPNSAPPAKKEQLAGLWDDPRLTVHTVGQTFDDSLEWALDHPEYGALLHAYDNPRVVSGQGTLIDDVLAHQPDTRHVVVPVGGGGLVGGLMKRLQELQRRDIHVHAVEAPGSNSLSLSLRNHRRVDADHPNARFGGSAVRRVGAQAMLQAADYPLLHVHSVSEDEVDDVIDDYHQDRTELLRRATPNFEPTSLVAIAGLAHIVTAYPDDVVTVIGTGKNEGLRAGPPPRTYRVPV